MIYQLNQLPDSPVCYWLKCCIGARFSKTRKEHCIVDPLTTQEVGRQTHYGLTRDTQETENFFCKGLGLLPLSSL